MNKNKMPLAEIRRILERGEWWDNVRDVSPDEPRPWLDELNGAIEAALDELQAYHDDENDGRLVRLPVQVGQTVYVVVNPSINIIGITPCLAKATVCSVEFTDNRYPRRIWSFYTDGIDSYYHGSEIGKSVFLTRVEAEKALQAIRAEAWGMGDEGTQN